MNEFLFGLSGLDFVTLAGRKKERKREKKKERKKERKNDRWILIDR